MAQAAAGEPAGPLKFPVLAILVFETAALVARSTWQVELRESGVEAGLANDLSYLVVPPVLAVLFVPILRRHGSWLLQKYSLGKLTWRCLLVGVLLGITLRLALWSGLIAGTALGLLKSADPHAIAGPLLSWQCPSAFRAALLLFATAALAPFIEESVNRGFVLHGLLARGRIFSVVTSSLVFALFHHPQSLMFALGVGVFFALATLNSGGLWISTVAHITNNMLAFFDWRCLRGHWNPVDFTPAVFGVGVMALTVLLVCVTYARRLVYRPTTGAYWRPR